MLEFLKKSVFTAVGLAVMTRDKIEELGKKMVEEAKMSETEGKQFIDELVKKSDETRLAMEKIINEKLDALLKGLKIPTRAEFNELDIRIRKLENTDEQETK
jgi:polyhydroxyalkanoate synthesis regulator phasin